MTVSHGRIPPSKRRRRGAPVTKHAKVYMTGDQYVTICRAADLVGLSLTAYLRTCALERATFALTTTATFVSPTQRLITMVPSAAPGGVTVSTGAALGRAGA